MKVFAKHTYDEIFNNATECFYEETTALSCKDWKIFGCIIKQRINSIDEAVIFTHVIKEKAGDIIELSYNHNKKILILSDILQSGYKETELYSEVAKLLKIKNISAFVGIGDSLLRNKNLFPGNSSFYISTEN